MIKIKKNSSVKNEAVSTINKAGMKGEFGREYIRFQGGTLNNYWRKT